MKFTKTFVFYFQKTIPQPLAIVKQENEGDKSSVTGNETTKLDSSITATLQSCCNEKALSIKIELKRQNENSLTQSQVDTDHHETSDEEELRSLVRKISSKRNAEHEFSEDDLLEDPKHSQKSKRQKRESIHEPGPQYSEKISTASDVDQSNVATISTTMNEDGKASELKILIDKLSHGETNDPENLLNTFENLIGKEGFSKLKSLLVQSQQSTQECSLKEILNDEHKPNLYVKPASEESLKSQEQNLVQHNEVIQEVQLKPKIIMNSEEQGEVLANGASSEDSDVPLEQLKLKKVKRKKKSTEKSPKKTRKSETTMLSDYINSSFIREGVLSAQGRRKNMRQLYAEDDLIQDELYDTECSNYSRPESLSSSSNDDNEKDDFEKRSLPLVNECRVNLELLDLKGIAMPVKILKDNRIDYESSTNDSEPNLLGEAEANKLQPIPMEENLSTECEEYRTGDDKSERSVEEDNKPSLSSLKPLEHSVKFEDCDIITIDDDEDEPCPEKPSINQTDIQPSPSKNVIKLEQLIYNLSFIECRGGVNLKCNCEKCIFETFDEQMFQYHIQTKHLLVKWSGSCKLCDGSVSNFGSLLDEYNHMNNYHINGDKSMTSKATVDSVDQKKKRGRHKKSDSVRTQELPHVSKNITVVKMKSPRKSLEKSEEPKSLLSVQKTNLLIVEKSSKVNKPSTDIPSAVQSVVTPVLKIRNLPGDKLSSVKNSFGTPTSSTETAFVSQSHFVNNNAVVQCHYQNTTFFIKPITQPAPITMFPIQKQQQQTVKIASVLPTLSKDQVTTIAPSTYQMKRLRPWLGTIDSKHPQVIAQMLTQKCLFDMYKCMGSKCNYHTNNASEFTYHLQEHSRHTPIDLVNYGRCSYCTFTSKLDEGLVMHLTIEHRNDKYACTKCFYRSVAEIHVIGHQAYYHKDESRRILLCDVEDVNYKKAIAEAKESRIKFIHPITCASKFFFSKYSVYHKNFIHRL